MMTDDEIRMMYARETGYQLDSAEADLLGFTRAIESHIAASASAEPADEEYELHCDGEYAAGCSGLGARDEIQHYARVYSQDGLVEIFKVTRTLIKE